MKHIINKCLLSLALSSLVITFLAGLYFGFLVGKESVCGDIAFYYHNDLPVKDCVQKGVK